MSKKNTAVEFLLEKFKSQNTLLFADDWEQAKEMEKQQIIDAYWEGCSNWDSEKEAEQYYNETFNK